MLGKGIVNKEASLAIVLAIFVHLVFLSLHIDSEPSANNATQKINITLTEQPLKRRVEPQLKKLSPRPKTKYSQLTDQAENKRPTKPSDAVELNLSPNSLSFDAFLRSEKQREKELRPNAPQAFADTFAPYFKESKQEPDTEYAQGPLGGGQYKVRTNDRVYCVLQMVPLSIDDQLYAFPPTSKDCTPKPRFDARIRASTLK